MDLTLGYSPCPNDTFIFYALVHGRLPAGGLRFRETLRDVETLNRMALASEFDVTKVSCAAFGGLRENYCLLRSGGALGRGCGPLVVAREKVEMAKLRRRRIAVPGRLTTAFLLLNLYDPALAENAVEMPFDEIMEAVRAGAADAGLIIHESRFTYPRLGLSEVADLGAWWEETTGRPIPLGSIIARRALGREVVGEAESLIRRSVQYAREHPAEAAGYIKAHARELDDEVIAEHIALYVNEFAVDIGPEGEAAVRELFRRAEESGIIRPSRLPLFMD